MRDTSRPDRRTFLSQLGLLGALAAWPARAAAALQSPARPRRVILDVDVGIDDATALLLAHYSPAIDLIGITTAFGNTTLEKSTRNALYIKERFGIEADVHPGAAAPLYLPGHPPPTYVHGVDGLGDVEERIAPTVAPAAPSAPEFIARSIREDPGGVTVVSVGPFTNLVMAGLLDPGIVERVQDVIIMGGSAFLAGELGNATTVAEANAFNDPHATDALFRAPWPITMVGLDVTYTADGAMDADYMAMLAREAGEAGRFVERINRAYARFYESARGVRTTFQHDSIAVAYAIAPELFETRRGKLQAVTEGFARGQTVFCPEGHHTSEQPEWVGRPLHRVCTRLDGPGFLKLYRETLVAGA